MDGGETHKQNYFIISPLTSAVFLGLKNFFFSIELKGYRGKGILVLDLIFKAFFHTLLEFVEIFLKQILVDYVVDS